MTTRREFVIAMSALLVYPLAANAQKTEKIYRIGILTNYPLASFFKDPLVATLRDLGFVEGQNLALESRSADNLAERLPRPAAELVRLNVDVIVTGGDAETLRDLEPAFSAIRRDRPDALFILVDQLLSPVVRPRIAQFAARERIPSIAANSGYAAEGGLIGYGPSAQIIYEIAAGQVAKILKGVNPGDLPIEQPSRLEFVINLRTARALGLTIPPSLLLRADQIIE